MTADGGSTDARLVERVLDGDREAFAQVYERYADRLFDFAHGMLRQREDAADAVADAFVTMAERLTQLRDPSRLRPWLYAVVRRECLRRLKARTRVAFGDDDRLAAVADDSATPDEQVESGALRELVWAAAEGLNDRDRALLDLHLRHGLDGQELADAMGITAGNAYTSLHRLRGQLERALGALLVARRGSDDCAELGTVLSDWDGRFTVLMRKRVARHVDACLVCDERRAALSPLSVVAGLPLLVAPSSLRDRVLGEVRLVGFSTSSAPGPAPAPRAADVRRQRLAMAVPAVAAAAIVVALVIGALADREAAEEPTLDAGASLQAPASSSPTVTVLPTPDPLTPLPVDPAPTATVPTPTAPTSAPPPSPPPPTPPGLVVTPPVLDLGELSRAGTVTLTNAGTDPLAYGCTASAAWVVPPQGGSLGAGESATLSVFVDRSAVPAGPAEATVTISWPGGSTTLIVRATGQAAPSDSPSLTTP